nr:MAG TPA: hypothetical protein [Caudoviricetes sp.]
MKVTVRIFLGRSRARRRTRVVPPLCGVRRVRVRAGARL